MDTIHFDRISNYWCSCFHNLLVLWLYSQFALLGRCVFRQREIVDHATIPTRTVYFNTQLKTCGYDLIFFFIYLLLVWKSLQRKILFVCNSYGRKGFFLFDLNINKLLSQELQKVNWKKSISRNDIYNGVGSYILEGSKIKEEPKKLTMIF